MTVDLNIEKAYIDVWLSDGESPPDLRFLHQQFPNCAITVFRSGTGNLSSLTAELLKTNL